MRLRDLVLVIISGSKVGEEQSGVPYITQTHAGTVLMALTLTISDTSTSYLTNIDLHSPD